MFLRDLRSRRITRVSVGAGGRQANGRSDGGAITADGRFVAFDSDAANLAADAPDGDQTDVFVRGPLPAGRG